MKKGLVIWLLALISFANANAQNNLPPVYEIKTDTVAYTTLDEAHWQVLEDPAGELSIEQISQSPLAEKFHPNNKQKIGFDYSIKAYWIRYRLRNSMTHEANITIPKRITYADLYTRSEDGKWNRKRTGRGIPWSKRNGFKRITAVSYIIPPGEELLIYERDNFVHDWDMFGLPAVEFGFTERVMQDEYLENNSSILPTILCGFLLLAALFNIYFFGIIRERVYLLFSFLLLSRAIGGFLQDTDLFFREDPITNGHLIGIFYFFYFFFMIHFVRYFLKTFQHFPRWDKVLIGLSIYLVAFSVLNLFHITRIGEPSTAILVFILFFTFLLFIRSSNKSVKWRMVMVLPAVSVFLSPLCTFLFFLLEKYTGKPVPAFIAWISDNFSTLEQIALIWLLLFFSWNLFERYQQLQKQIAEETLAKERLAKEKEMERYQLIAQQKVDLEVQVKDRTSQLNQSLNDLKSTQAQLIQAEKMASLGELTAGIAHEIQNPLNFMNNFSEVNKELLVEMKDEIDKGNGEEVKSIANSVIANEEKINHHGKRADAIVKGMLQHSRTSTGQKEPVDLNALADEYLRLAYQGYRAKDKTFNTVLETNFDQTIANMNVVPQDIGRVLLNLFNNAFYAVSEKKKLQLEGLSAEALAKVEYEPTVFLSTRKTDGKVEIKIRDNGNGIPQKVRDKIFQPFFTTKATGQGTGLGLSLSYDIVKAHGGEISFDSREGEFAEFVIQLPIPPIM